MKTEDLMQALTFDTITTAPSPIGISLWDENEPREFALGDDHYHYRAWDGEEIGGDFISIDTETVNIGRRLDDGEVPELVIVSASGIDSDDNYIVHPDDVARFIMTNSGKQAAFFHIGFDVPVMLKALEEREEAEAILTLWRMVDEGRSHDAMLLDQLVRLAEGHEPYYQRSLAVVASETVGVELEKDGSPRLRYDMLLKLGYEDVDPEFYEFAVKDARATLMAFEVLWEKAWKLHDNYTHEKSTESDATRADPWAPLTEQVQVRSALALHRMANRGVRVDVEKLNGIIAAKQDELAVAIKAFESDEAVKAFEKKGGKRILRHDKKGQVELTAKGGPGREIKDVRSLFAALCEKHGEYAPKTAKDLVSTARDDYVGLEAAANEPAFGRYFQLQDIASELSKAREISAEVAADGRVHSRYTALVKTGRSTCRSPQVQNLPRTGELRGCFVPREGHVLYSVDYAAVELAALASICRHRYGYSHLGDRIDAGEDPHAFTAAQVLGKEAKDVTKDERQAAKVYNFGVPGGMGSKTLVRHAKVAYGVDMTLDEAETWKQKLIRDVYPEMGEFLDDHLGRFIADALGIPAKDIIDELVYCTDSDRFSANAREWILSATERCLRTGRKRNGDPYNARWTDGIWLGLEKIHEQSMARDGKGPNGQIGRYLKAQTVGRATAKALFPTRAVTLTGRVWSDVNFRQGHNAQFQGLAADGAKLALYRLTREGYEPVLFVHDELVFELPDDEGKEEMAKEIDRVMIKEMARVISDVPIRVEGNFMRRWTK